MASSSASDDRTARELTREYGRFGHRAVGRDAFPVLNDPEMISAQKADEKLRGNQWVLGVTHNGEARAYPISVMGVHELVNDHVGGEPIAVCW